MAAKIYHYADAGAPNGSTSTLGYVILKAILDACLVNGYGSKEPAGWTAVPGGTTSKFAYQNASNTCTVLYRYLTTNWVKQYVMDTWTNSAAGMIGGVNIRSGGYSTPLTSSTAAGGVNTGFGTAANSTYGSFVRWTLVADEDTFVLWLMCSDTPTNFRTIYPLTLYVGKYENFAGLTGHGSVCACIPVNSTATTANATQRQFTNFDFLRNPLDGISASPAVGGATPWNHPNSITFQTIPNTAFIDDTSQKLQLYRPRLRNTVNTAAVGTKFVGHLRGIAADTVYDDFHIDMLSKILGNTLNTTAQYGKPVLMPDGHWWAAVGWHQKNVFLTTNPDFW